MFAPIPLVKLGRIGKSGDGPQQYSDLLVPTNLLINRKPNGQALIAGDDSIGKLSFPQPRYQGTSRNNALWGDQFHDELAYQNHYRWYQQQTQGYDTNVRFTQQYRINTPIALPNIIPTRIHFP
jgi:hypothetical protein